MIIQKDVYEKYVKTYTKGSVIFEEGDPGLEMFIIIEGEVEIRKKTSPTTSKTLIVFHKGDIFGEMAIIEKKTRSASAITNKLSRLLVMNNNLLESMIDTNPDFARKLIRMLSERIRKANATIQNMTITNRQNQIMNGLYEYARENGTSSFKGVRVNTANFSKWAQVHIGIKDIDIKNAIQNFLKRGQVKTSAVGKEEILVEMRNEQNRQNL